MSTAAIGLTATNLSRVIFMSYIFLGVDASSWLGPQGEYATTRLFWKTLRNDEEREKVIGSLDISIKIEKGRDISLADSPNPSFTVVDGQYKKLAKDEIEPEKLYVVGKVIVSKTKPSFNFYAIRARVTDGPLKGTVVNLLDGTSRKNTGSPSSCAFQLPSDIKIDQGELKFEVFEVYCK